MTAVLAIDVGTSAVKVAVVIDGEVARVAEVVHPLSTPRPGWSEQHPDDWWAATRRAITEVLAGDSIEAGTIEPGAIDPGTIDPGTIDPGTIDPGAIDPGAIEVVAVTGQMQDLVAVDVDGRAVRPAILYSDVRAADEHAALIASLGAERWAGAIGATPDASNVAAKWRWLTTHEPDAGAATSTALFGAHSYVVLQLTGERVCDPTTAATTGLYDLTGSTWWGPIVELIGIPTPTIVPATAIAGQLRPGIAAEFGLPVGLPVVHANGDAVATTVGVVGRELGRPYAYLGTSGWVAVGASIPPVGEGVIVLPGLDADHWVGAAPMPTAGGALDWVRTTLLRDDGTTGDGLDAIVGDACAAADGVMFLPHLDGARIPVAAPDATGVLVGVRRSTSRATVAAAALEGVAHAVRQLGEVVAPDADELVLCGGAARSATLRQVMADVCGVPVLHRPADHAAVLGAAAAATIALAGEVRPPTALDAPVRPRPERAEIHRRSAVVFDDLLPTMQRLLTSLVEIRSTSSPSNAAPADRPEA